jgi:hypothetical protein
MELGSHTFQALLADINRRVFFWAGRHDGPGAHGKAHFNRYASEAPIILRVPMADLLREGDPELCRYNSGSPRHTLVRGVARPSPRGSGTFVPLAEWQERPSKVIEVTFLNSVALPGSTEWADRPTGAWHPLFIAPLSAGVSQ